MNKGLEALNKLVSHIETEYHSDDYYECINARDTIEKESKALEIIKREFKPIIFEHDFGKYYLKLSKDNTMVLYEIKTQEEYELLKEVLL